MSEMRIVKLGSDDPPPLSKTSTTPPKPMPMVPAPPSKNEGGKRKSMKTFPRGILKTKKAKIHGVSDPAKAPPLKKFMKKHTIRLLTDKGVSKQKKTIKRKLDKMSDQKVKQIAMKHGLVKSADVPPKLAREMLGSAMIAGFVSSE
jgi:hypothetical protein